MEFGQLKVLVVEDRDFQRDMALRLLGELGVATPTACASGREALDRLAAGPAPDVVIAALELGDVDGADLVRQIADRDLARAVILTSDLEPVPLGPVEQHARQRGLQLLGQLEKPLSRDRLLSLLRRYRREPPTSSAAGVPSLDEIGEALTQRRFSLAFQPVVDLASGRLTGAEVLVRWQRDPGAALLLPDQIIPGLERQGRISELSRWMLEQTAEQWTAWQAQGLSLDLSINISMRDLQGIATADAYDDAVRARGADPHRLVLELTESDVEPASPALEVLARLRQKGFGLAVDDYGTGLSSLEQFSQLPFTELKIDRGFVANCDRDARRRGVVDAALALARTLGLRTVAEGVQTRQEWAVLRDAGCAHAQGWLIAKAMPAGEFVAWAAAYRPQPG